MRCNWIAAALLALALSQSAAAQGVVQYGSGGGGSRYHPEATYLPQGWTRDEVQLWYHLS